MITRPRWAAGRVRLAGFAALTLLSTTGFALPPPPGAVGEAVEALGVPDIPAAIVPTAGGEDLKGLFRIDAASCGGSASGSYFRMIQPGGSPDGPFIENNSSACADKTYTDLQPGRDGGLSTAAHQPHPDPAFDAGGNGVADRITMPKGFFGRNFSTATNSTDPQTSTAAPVPTVTHDGAGKLGGNMSAFAAAYQGQHFNQGAPKPDKSNPGLTSGPTGTYDAATRRFTLEWSSTIVGGPFNNFTGRWHLEGTFEPASSTPAEAPRNPDQGDPGDGILGLPLPLPGAQPSSAGSHGAPAPARLTAGQAAGELKGLFRLTAASCASGTPSGTYFRMIQPGGSAANGPYLSNTSSTCSDKSYTDMQPGKDGGLSTVAFQPQPDPPFTSEGGSQQGANDKITQPKEFFGSKYATATNPTDPQTSLATILPKIVVDGAGMITGDMRAFAAAYQGQHFNQGAPKPDGSTPGATTALSGTYDAATKKFTMEWASTIVGGAFDNFTGKWHFEGVFEPAVTETTTTTPVGGSGTSGGSTGSSGSSTLPSSGGTGQTTTGQVAGTGVTARTGPPWPATLPAALLVLALAGRRLSRRPQEG
ncbi:MAG: hypothetical protein ACRD0C_10200 [Acidimicrobiia bacterium]